MCERLLWTFGLPQIDCIVYICSLNFFYAFQISEFHFSEVFSQHKIYSDSSTYPNPQFIPHLQIKNKVSEIMKKFLIKPLVKILGSLI